MRSDPFGSAVYDYHEGKRDDPCIIERDDGYKTEELLRPYFETEDAWAEEEGEALGEVGNRILDIGCGPGRHLLGLQKKAIAIGLDVSELVLKVCRSRGGIRLVLGSARRLPFKAGSFDTVLLLTNGLGISGGIEKTAEMLEEVKVVLVGRGTLIAHTTDPTDVEQGIDDEYRLKNIAENRPLGSLRIRVVYKEAVGPWFELMLMSPREVLAILGMAGFRIVRSIEWGGSRLYIASPAWKAGR